MNQVGGNAVENVEISILGRYTRENAATGRTRNLKKKRKKENKIMVTY